MITSSKEKKCRGRDNSQDGQGGMGAKSLRTPGLTPPTMMM